MMPTLAPNTTSKSRESHVPEDILRVLPHPKSTYGDACRVREWSDFAALLRTAAGIRGVGGLNMSTACAASAVTSANSLKFCCYRQLNYTRLRAPRSRKTGRYTLNVTILDKRLEGGCRRAVP